MTKIKKFVLGLALLISWGLLILAVKSFWTGSH